MNCDALSPLPWLSDEAQRWHATMVLGGWTFRRQYGVYTVVDPQGWTMVSRYTFFNAVHAAWNL